MSITEWDKRYLFVVAWFLAQAYVLEAKASKILLALKVAKMTHLDLLVQIYLDTLWRTGVSVSKLAGPKKLKAQLEVSKRGQILTNSNNGHLISGEQFKKAKWQPWVDFTSVLRAQIPKAQKDNCLFWAFGICMHKSFV